jgi:hypothetical protein
MSTAKQEVQASTEARTRPRVANLLMIRYLGSVRLPDLLLLSQQGVRQAEYRPPGKGSHTGRPGAAQNRGRRGGGRRRRSSHAIEARMTDRGTIGASRMANE